MAQHTRPEAGTPAATEQQILEERKATDKISGNPHALVKPVFGAEGSRTFVTTANPFPVTVAAGTTITPKFARIDQTTTDSTAILAAVSGKKLRVTALLLRTSDTTLREFSLLSSTTEIATYWISATQPLLLVPDPNGYFETVANEALNLQHTAAVIITGSLVYIEV